MSDTSRKIADELTTAYKTEVKGYFYYSAAADLMENERGRKVFSHLATDELDHIKVVYALAESLKAGRGWLDYAEAVKAGVDGPTKAAEIFPGENELVKMLEENQTDLNAVSIGIEIEENAVDFYSGLLKGADTPEEKVVLTELLEMEKGHLKILRWEAEALKRTGFWGDTMEFSVEKEKDGE